MLSTSAAYAWTAQAPVSTAANIIVLLRFIMVISSAVISGISMSFGIPDRCKYTLKLSMRITPIACAAGVLCGFWLQAADIKMTYPPARRSDQVDNLHGVRVEDPYRWLEDADSPETKAWVAAENALTASYLHKIPGRERIVRRLTELWNFERFTDFFQAGGRYFYSRNDGLQNQNVLYTVPSVDGAGRVLLDPNTLSKDGTVALTGLSVSDN